MSIKSDWTHIAMCASVIAIGAAMAVTHWGDRTEPAPVSCPIYSDVADQRAELNDLAAQVIALEHAAGDETGRDDERSDTRDNALRCALQHMAERACKVNAQGRTRCLPELTPWPGWEGWERCKVCGYGRDCNLHGGPTHRRAAR